MHNIAKLARREMKVKKSAGKRGGVGARTLGSGPIKAPWGGAVPSKTRSGGNEAMTGNITATPYRPAAEFGVIAQPR